MSAFKPKVFRLTKEPTQIQFYLNCIILQNTNRNRNRNINNSKCNRQKQKPSAYKWIIREVCIPRLFRVIFIFRWFRLFSCFALEIERAKCETAAWNAQSKICSLFFTFQWKNRYRSRLFIWLVVQALRNGSITTRHYLNFISRVGSTTESDCHSNHSVTLKRWKQKGK